MEMQMSPMIDFGPMAQGGGAHGVVSGLARGVAQRMSLKESIKAQAMDLATAESELVNLDPIGVYRLKVKKTRFEDKVNGGIRDELTLVSPDFNEEPISKWTDAGEHGTGTKEDYSRIVNWANELATTDGDATLIWVSPGEKIIDDNGISIPEHRAYVLRKQNDGSVMASAYQLTGPRESLSLMMKKLGYENKDDGELIEDQRILLKGPTSKVTHKDLYKAYTSSLSQEILTRNISYIRRFGKEANKSSDADRWTIIRQNSQKYEAQLQDTYKGDIESAVKSIAQGFAAISRLDGNSDQRERLSPQDAGDSRNNTAYFDYIKKHQEGSQKDEQAKIYEILQPIIPAVVGFINIISRDNERLGVSEIRLENNGINTTDKKPTSDNGLAKTQIMKDPEDKEGIHRISDDIYNLPDMFFIDESKNSVISEQIFWQEVISMMFQPVSAGIEESHFSPERKTGIVMTEHGSKLLFTQRSFNELFIDFKPLLHKNEARDSLVVKSEDPMRITKSFLQGLEAVGELLSHNFDEEPDNDLSAEKKLQQKTIETEVAKLGIELIQELIGDKSLFDRLKEGEYEIKIDDFAQLSFLLHAYENTDSSEAVKQLLAALIFKQIQSIQTDKELFSQNPKLVDIFKKFTLLSPHTNFLDKKFELILLELQKLCQENAYIRNGLNIAGKDNICKLIFIICNTARLTDFEDLISDSKQAQFSIEKLQRLSGLNTRMMIINQFKHKKNSKKTVKKFVPYGIIYQYQHSKGLFVPPGGTITALCGAYKTAY